jgi:hypothetical protein
LAEVANDAERHARFRREAQVLASLNRPTSLAANIRPRIYGVLNWAQRLRRNAGFPN